MTKQVEDLKKKLEAKNRDYGRPFLYDECHLLSFFVDILKKQAGQNQQEYDRLATEFNTKTGSISDKRKD